MSLSSKKPQIVIGAICCAALVNFIASLRPWELHYHGQPLSYWLDQIILWQEGYGDTPPILAFRAMGTNVVPALLPYITVLPDPIDAKPRRMQACKAICAIGPSAQQALRPLTNALFSGAIDRDITSALASLGSAGTASLLAALTNESRSARGEIVIGLGWTRNADSNVVAVLVSMLEDPSFQTPVVISLGRIHQHPEIAVPALMRVAAGGDRASHIWAINALSQFGPDAKAAIPLLKEALHDPDTHDQASLALQVITAEQNALPKRTP
jgi:hypothetical protein